MRTGMMLSAMVVCSLGAQAQMPTTWSYELQCRSSLDVSTPAFNLPFPSSLSSQYVTIGEDGGVAIRAFLGGAEGIFYGKDGAGSIIVQETGTGDPVWSTTMDLRNGMIGVEQGNFGDGAELYAIDGSLINTFNAGGPEGVAGFSGLTITSDGALCYRGDFGFLGDKVVIDEYLPARTQTVVADTYSGTYTFVISPEINDMRQVAFNSIPETGPSRRIVRIEPDLSTTTIAETGPVWSSFVNSVALAQDGKVAFSARRAADSIWEVVVADGASSTPVATGADPDINNGSLANFPPAVNSSGWVAFRATDVSNDATAIWVTDGTTTVKLAEFGQIIDTDLGPIPMGFDFGPDNGKQVANGVVDINDNGQVAFASFLSNGTIGVFVATPVFDVCEADLDGNGELDFFDLSAFLMAFGNMDRSADLDENGSFDFFDLSAYLALYNAGCP